jgi:hypothetical protein
MDDVSELKVERGDCKAILEKAKNDKRDETDPKASHHKDAGKKP